MKGNNDKKQNKGGRRPKTTQVSIAMFFVLPMKKMPNFYRFMKHRE